MSRIFVSHSSANNAEALAIGQWLAASGWSDYFLDVSPARGLAAGETWQSALKSAADRCEAVICLLSPTWAASKWCLAEFLLAKQLGKQIFGVLVEPTPLDELPVELTAESQVCDLVAGERRQTFHVEQDPIVAAADVSLAADGLARLRLGLQRAGLDPGSFAWPPQNDPLRLPYRGLRAHEPDDAAVFFGREASIVRALDALRARRESSAERLFVILGASGSGKSSFLRAGLWPRLARDDRHFLPLPVLRPGRTPLSGATGLAACVEAALKQLKVPRSLAAITETLQQEDGLSRLLAELQELAGRRIGAACRAELPTIVLSIDQGEELFARDGRQEAERVLRAIRCALMPMPPAAAATTSIRPPLLIVAIRSDAYEQLQMEKSLYGIGSCLFDLRPLNRSEYKSVIEGPAMRASEAGQPLQLDPLLTERLIEDAEGADALPLLAFTLERLYLQYGSVGRLQLADYEALGGVRGSIEAAVQSALDEPGREPAIPADPELQRQLLHLAFVPWLARVDPETEQRKRRVARWDEIPAESIPLLERLIERRLLVKGGRTGGPAEGAATIEVAHEALLRQWPTLTAWLKEDALALKTLEAVERAATEWAKKRDGGAAAEAWLVHTGERLTAAEALRLRPDFERQLGEDGRAYVVACRARDDRVRQEREERLRQIQAERDRAEEERARAENEAANARRAADIAEQARHRATARTRLAIVALCVVALTSVLTGLFYKRARDSQEQANLSAESAARQSRLALSSSLASQSRYYADKRPDQSVLLALAAVAVEPIVEARSALLSALLDNPKLRALLHDDARVNAIAIDPAGALLATAGEDGQVRLWNVALATADGDRLQHSSSVTAVAFDPIGRRIASATSKGEVILWDAASRKRLLTMAPEYRGMTNGLAFSPDGRLLASAGSDRKVRLWSPATGEAAGEPLASFSDRVTSVAFSPDGRTVGSGAGDGSVVFWDVVTRQSTPLKKVHNFPVTCVAFDTAGALFASGSRDGSVAIWDVGTRTKRDLLYSSERKQRPVTAIAFSPDGVTLAVGTDDGTIELWDVSAKDATRLVTTLTGHRDAVSALAFGPSPQFLASAAAAGPTVLWDLQRESRIAEPLQAQPSAVNAVAFGGAHDELLAIGARDGTIQVWDAATRRFRPSPIVTDGEVKSLVLSADGGLLVSGSVHGRVTFLDGDTGKPLGEPLSAHAGAVTSIALSVDGRTLASSSEDRRVLIWDASARRLRGGALKHDDWVRAVALDPAARTLAAAVNDGAVILWDVASEETIGRLSAHGEAAIAVAFSADGNWLASGGFDQSAILWNVETRQPLGAPLAGHKGAVSAVAFSADLLATAGFDGATVLWDLDTRKQLGRPL